MCNDFSVATKLYIEQCYVSEEDLKIFQEIDDVKEQYL